MIDEPIDEPLDYQRAFRLLRAKAVELEAYMNGQPGTETIDWLIADVALIARLLADHLDDSSRHFD